MRKAFPCDHVIMTYKYTASCLQGRHKTTHRKAVHIFCWLRCTVRTQTWRWCTKKVIDIRNKQQYRFTFCLMQLFHTILYITLWHLHTAVFYMLLVWDFEMFCQKWRYKTVKSVQWKPSEKARDVSLKLQTLVHFHPPLFTNYVYFTHYDRPPLLKSHYLGLHS